MKPIIALTDFSPISANAVNYAADMAASLNTSLTVLHVCLVPMTFSDVPYPPEKLIELMQSAEVNMAALKSDLDKRMQGRIEIGTMVTTGTIIPATENYCRDKNPYAVVMGTQGAGAVQRVFFGSNTLGLINKLEWPLIVVPPEATFSAIRKIGLACDLEDVDNTIPFEEVKWLVNQFKAELHVLHVTGRSGPGGEEAAETRSLQNMLVDQNPVYHFLPENSVEEGLEKFAGDNQLDILIVVPKKHYLLDRLFHRSHSKRLVLRTQVPVMSIHE